MAIQSSVFVLASLLFAAHALTGLRKRGGSQVDAQSTFPVVPDELGCPSRRFPSLTRCRILMGPCLGQLDKCDKFYAADPIPPFTDSVRRRAGIDRTPAVKKATQGCEMATCLAQCGPGEDSTVNGGVVKGPGFKQRTANQPTQPTTIATKAEYQVATLCTHRFMDEHKTEWDKSLMKCVQLRAKTVDKQPFWNTVTTTPAPGPANWFCVTSMNFDRRGGRDIKSRVEGPFLTIAAAKTQLDSTAGMKKIEQFICEIRVPNKYTNTMDSIGKPPGYVPPLMDGIVTQTPHKLGAVANITTSSHLYLRPTAGWGPDTAQDDTAQSGGGFAFNVQCKIGSLGTIKPIINSAYFCPDKAAMLQNCQHDVKCNPPLWR